MGVKIRRLVGAQIPTGTAELPDPPAALFLAGRIPPGPRVAIVGTRRPTSEALAFAFELAHDLARAGVVVLSGGALGIDTAAHQGALRAGGGTLVVGPSSYCCPYPEENRPLFDEIVRAEGGYLSSFGAPTPARRHAFFARNALLVSLSSTVVLVQAPYRSGARNALLWARRLHKTAWIVPHPPWCTRSGASIAELRLGGVPLWRAKDILEWLSRRQLHAVPPARPVTRGNMVEMAGEAGSQGGAAISLDGHGAARPDQPPLPAVRPSPEEADVRCLLEHLRPRVPGKSPGNAGSDEVHPDLLCQRLGWNAARLNSVVLYATLRGDVERRPSGNIACTRRGLGRG